MTAGNNLTRPSGKELLIKRVLTGAAIGLVLISIFVIPSLKNAPAEWGKYWMIRPLIVTPLFGVLAGCCNHALDFLRKEGGAKKIVANILAVLVYVLVLWFGTVAGLGGTMWD